MSHQPNPFINMTLDDIDAWVEGSTADTGKKIQQQGGISNICLTEDGDLLAWVEGTSRHAVMIFFEDQILTSACSCTAPGACKHAVAAVYEALYLNSEKIVLPLTNEDDERLTLLSDLNETPSEMDLYLNGLSRDELMDLIFDLANEIPSVEEELSCRMDEIFDKEDR